MEREIHHPSTTIPSPKRNILTLVILAIVGAALVRAGAAASPASVGPPAILTPSGGAYLGARVEPRGGESLLDAIQRVESQIGRRFAIDHFYYDWTSSFPGPAQSLTVAQGRIPFINWRAGTRWSEIANGSQDSLIAAKADAIKEFGFPIYLTFHHEPENDLGSYGSPQDYAAAFRRVVTIFRDRGVSNVGFVWTLMSWTFNPRSGRDANEYYPGDGYVDIVGADGYNFYPGRAGDEWNPFQAIFTDVNGYAVSRGKPWMVVEYGAQEDPAYPGRKGQWLRDALATAKTWPALKALIYFDVDKVYNWVTDTSSSSMAAYREIAQDPYLNPSPTQPPVPSPSPTQPPVPSPSPTQPPVPPTGPGTLANDLDGGPLGASVESNYAGSSGDAFDGVAIGDAASLVYDDTHVRGTGLSARHTVGYRENAYYKWGPSLDAWNSLSGRVYVWFDALPSGDLRLIRGKDGTELSFAIDILDDGRLRAQDRSNESIAQTSTAIITGGWVRIEWRVDMTIGQVDLLIFNSPDSTIPTDWATSGPGRALGRGGGALHIGRSGSQPFFAVFWTDDPAVSTGGFLGPSP